MRPILASTKLILILTALFIPFSMVQGANTIHVPADQATIQAAINVASNGDTVIVAPGTYQENINFSGKAITVTSSGGPQTTIIDGGHQNSVVTFSTSEGTTSVLNGFTIQNGFPTNMFDEGGGIYVYNASPTITNNIITNNQACSAAGIAINYGASPSFRATPSLRIIRGDAVAVHGVAESVSTRAVRLKL